MSHPLPLLPGTIVHFDGPKRDEEGDWIVVSSAVQTTTRCQREGKLWKPVPKAERHKSTQVTITRDPTSPTSPTLTVHRHQVSIGKDNSALLRTVGQNPETLFTEGITTLARVAAANKESELLWGEAPVIGLSKEVNADVFTVLMLVEREFTQLVNELIPRWRERRGKKTKTSAKQATTHTLRVDKIKRGICTLLDLPVAEGGYSAADFTRQDSYKAGLFGLLDVIGADAVILAKVLARMEAAS